ncbi:MAG: extracellular solute-binding protein [Clostridia bacterium]|nr:extracellular solute-binding protein [Clostridia bacterium]
MKKAKFQKITAFLLAAIMLIGCGTLGVGAASGDSSITDITTSDIKELLNAISYNDYVDDNKDVEAAEEELIFSAVKNWTYVSKKGVVYNEEGLVENEFSTEADALDKVDKSTIAYVDEFDGKTGLYTPSSGVVTWTLDGIEEAKKYSLAIDYYPIANKSASIERIFMINGSVPFAEARYLTISKIWKNEYPDGQFEVPDGESAQDYISAAEKLGIKAEKVEKTVKGKTVECVSYTMPEYWTSDIAELVDEQTVRFFTIDIDLNEIRASLQQAPSWTTYNFKDSNGFMQDTFEFVIGPDEETGEVTVSLESVNEPIVISDIKLIPHEDRMSYDDYLAKYEGKGDGEGKIKIEAEYFSAVSSQTIYPASDNTSAINSPAANDRTVLNTVGGDKWQNASQWIEYQFSVEKSGMYQIATRFKQSTLEGMYTSRILYLYSDETLAEGEDGYYDGVPFEEASRLQFSYASDWQSGMLTDANDTKFKFYFEEGVVYTMRLEVSLGEMGDIVRRVQESLDNINADYLNILKLTGTTPDEYRDYGFSRVMPDTKRDMIKQKGVLEAVSKELNESSNIKGSSMTATLDQVSRLLDTMGKDDNAIAKNLEQLKTYIGSLGTWVGDAKTQPLTLDFLVIQPADDDELPAAKAGFFKSFAYEMGSFFQSFFRNYDRMGAMEEIDENESVEVWLAYGRDQSQVIRGLINDDFTPHYNVAVNLKLVAGATLLPSILSGMGPDVYIGIAQGDVINYAIRGALTPLDEIVSAEELDAATAEFNEAAMMVLQIECAGENGNYEEHYKCGHGQLHTYGLPETQNFNMMFVREDILADLNIDIPKTWEDVKEAIPILQANNMQIAMHNDCKIFLYQMDGELFADGGMRINLDSNVALDAFDTMCAMFTEYSFPYKYDFPNRFRTGEMPIGFATYTATYNQLKVFATEIEGLWSFYPMPGYATEDGGINNVSVSTATAISIINGCEDLEGAWKFLKWHVGAQCQIDYSNEMVAILGPSAKHATANEAALESLPWTDEEYEQLQLQFNNLAAVPNYPGSYIIDRYTKFAFLSAFNDGLDPVTELQSYIKTINVEITRKREEFGLETLKDGQTLAEKRLEEAETKLLEIRESDDYKAAYDDVCNGLLKLIEGYETEDYASIRSMSDALAELDSSLFAGVVSDLESAADALETYEAYK